MRRFVVPKRRRCHQLVYPYHILRHIGCQDGDVGLPVVLCPIGYLNKVLPKRRQCCGWRCAQVARTAPSSAGQAVDVGPVLPVGRPPRNLCSRRQDRLKIALAAATAFAAYSRQHVAQRRIVQRPFANAFFGSDEKTPLIHAAGYVSSRCLCICFDLFQVHQVFSTRGVIVEVLCVLCRQNRVCWVFHLPVQRRQVKLCRTCGLEVHVFGRWYSHASGIFHNGAVRHKLPY